MTSDISISGTPLVKATWFLMIALLIDQQAGCCCLEWELHESSLQLSRGLQSFWPFTAWGSLGLEKFPQMQSVLRHLLNLESEASYSPPLALLFHGVENEQNLTWKFAVEDDSRWYSGGLAESVPNQTAYLFIQPEEKAQHESDHRTHGLCFPVSYSLLGKTDTKQKTMQINYRDKNITGRNAVLWGSKQRKGWLRGDGRKIKPERG